MKNQNASAEYPHIPAKGSLQTALPMAALRSLPLLQWRQSTEGPCVMGGVLFFKLQRFFCGKAAGFPPPPLNAGLYSLSIAARCHARRFRHLCSKKLVYPI